MTHTHTNYRGFVIQKRIDVLKNTAIIYRNNELVKCIAGNILADGSENSIEKAKQWIDKKSFNQ